MSQVQIKLFDYRNASFQGQAIQHVPHGLGSCLTEDFLYCISLWDKGNLHGPCFTVFPSEKILYGMFKNNNAEDLICFELSKECQIYCIYKNGKIDKHMAAAFPYIKCVLQVFLGEDDIIDRQKEHDYQNNIEKWNILQNIFRTDVPQWMRSPNRFLNNFFVSKFKEVEEIYAKQYFFGMAGEGLGFKLDLPELFIESIGFYDANKVLKLLGRRSINRDKRVKQEGIYQKPETLVRYQERPTTIKKNYRDFFRLSIDFHNKFIYFPTLQKMQKQMLNLRTNMIKNTTERIAQQLIEHLDHVTLQENFDRIQEKPVNNRANFERATPMENVTIDQLKEEIHRSKSHKKTRDNVSPYKKFNIQPAELKYTSNSGRKNQFINSPGYERSQTQEYNFDHSIIQGINRNYYQQPSQFTPQTRQPRYRDKIRKINYTQEQPKSYEIKQSEPRRYPIEQNLRTNNRNTSRSPIKLEHRPVKYQYVDDPVNPEKAESGYPGKLANRLYGNTKRETSTSPNTKARIDHLSSLYDDIKAGSKQPQSDKKYPLNHGKGYQYNQGQLDTKMGLVRGERRVQSPKKHLSSALPYKPEPKYTQNYPKYDYKYDVDRYDRQRQNRYENLDYIRKPSREKKLNYGYFDKNR